MKYKLDELFEKPISGEWGTEVEEGQKGVNVIRTTNFTNLGTLNLNDVVNRNIDVNKYKSKLLKNGDIIIEKSGGSPKQPVGRVVIFDGNSEEHYFCNNFTAILRPTEKVNSKYALYLMKDLYNKRKVLKFQNKTTGIINLKLNDYLKNTEVNIPELDKQIRIFKALDKAQELIDKRRIQLEDLDELVKSRFIEMFGDEDNEHKVSELFNYVSRGKSPNYVELSEVKIINQACIYWSGILFEKVKYQDINKVTDSKLLLENDILLNSTGTGTLGRCNVFNKPDNNKYIADSHVTVLRPKEGIINAIYFKYYIQQENNQKELYRKCVNGSTNQIELSKESLLKFNIILPDIELQNEFADFVKQVDKLKFEIEESLKELEDNFNSLMQKAFKGELFN